jgi:hypothetical protein
LRKLDARRRTRREGRGARGDLRGRGRARQHAAVCRKSYVHPKVAEAWVAGVDAKPIALRGLRADEQATLGMLEAMRRSAKAVARSPRAANARAGAPASAAAG